MRHCSRPCRRPAPARARRARGARRRRVILGAVAPTSSRVVRHRGGRRRRRLSDGPARTSSFGTARGASRSRPPCARTAPAKPNSRVSALPPSRAARSRAASGTRRRSRRFGQVFEAFRVGPASREDSRCGRRRRPAAAGAPIRRGRRPRGRRGSSRRRGGQARRFGLQVVARR